MTTQIKGNDTSTFGGNIDVPQIITDAPAFSAYKSSNQSISSSTSTKIVFDTEEYDINSNYDTSTSRFTPTVAGYYQVNLSCDCAANSSTFTRNTLSVFKNGSNYKTSGGIVSGTSSTEFIGNISTLVYLNGSTDYIEGYAYLVGTSPIIYSGSVWSWFNAVLVRAV